MHMSHVDGEPTIDEYEYTKPEHPRGVSGSTTVEWIRWDCSSARVNVSYLPVSVAAAVGDST